MSESTTDTAQANDRQVGGAHYRRGVGLPQHWDLMGRYGIDYFRASATAYIQRWREKNGLEDLEKADHYLEKYLELLRNPSGDKIYFERPVAPGVLLEWATAVSMPAAELEVCYIALVTRDVALARRKLQQLMQFERFPKNAFFVVPAPGKTIEEIFPPPGTPEDGGHHARQEAEEAEEIQNWTRAEYDSNRLPRSMSEHEYRHRLDTAYQSLYAFNVSAARWIIRAEYASCTMNGRQD